MDAKPEGRAAGGGCGCAAGPCRPTRTSSTTRAEVERLLEVIATGNPRAMRFIPLPRRPDGRLEPDALAAAIQHGFRIVRWHLDARP